MELISTSPSFLGHDGLNYVNQMRELAERAGLKPELVGRRWEG